MGLVRRGRGDGGAGRSCEGLYKVNRSIQWGCCNRAGIGARDRLLRGAVVFPGPVLRLDLACLVVHAPSELRSALIPGLVVALSLSLSIGPCREQTQRWLDRSPRTPAVGTCRVDRDLVALSSRGADINPVLDSLPKKATPCRCSDESLLRQASGRSRRAKSGLVPGTPGPRPSLEPVKNAPSSFTPSSRPPSESHPPQRQRFPQGLRPASHSIDPACSSHPIGPMVGRGRWGAL